MSATKLNILLVDDDPAMQRMLTSWLAGAGYRVRRAEDGRSAMAAIESDPPHVLITDWEMPQVNGLELCRWLRAQNLPHYVYTIFLSVRDRSEDLVRGLEAGADDFLRKPIDRGELLARLRAATRLIELESRLSRLAKCDPLTELPTQRTLYEYFRREWTRSERYHFPISCVMLDIDFFKRINDTFGHGAGDGVIRQIAAVLTGNCRASDVVSRYGGEEFCVLLPETNEQSAVRWADRIRRIVAQTTTAVEGRLIRVTASFGVAQRLADTESPQQLVDLADQALLVAKRSGRDRVVGFQSINASGQIQAAGGPAAIFGGLVAKNVMTTIVAGLNQDDLVGHAARYFLRLRINSAPVVDRDGKLVGILAEKDVMSIMLGPNWWEMKIKDVMKKNVVCYEEETPVLSIYEFLCRVSIRGVIIVREGRPTGVITRGSLLRWFTNSHAVRMLAAMGEPAAEPSREPPSPAATPRQRLEKTCRALAGETAELARRLQTDDSDLVPCVVGSASRMQELVNDLLAYSRYANDASEDQTSADDQLETPSSDLQQGLGQIAAKWSGGPVASDA